MELGHGLGERHGRFVLGRDVRQEVQEKHQVRMLFLQTRENLAVIRKRQRAWFVADGKSPHCGMMPVRIPVCPLNPMSKRTFLLDAAVETRRSAVPRRLHTAHKGAESMLVEQVENADLRKVRRGTYADEEIYAAFLRLLDMPFRLGIFLEIVCADIQPRAVHSAKNRQRRQKHRRQRRRFFTRLHFNMAWLAREYLWREDSFAGSPSCRTRPTEPSGSQACVRS